MTTGTEATNEDTTAATGAAVGADGKAVEEVSRDTNPGKDAEGEDKTTDDKSKSDDKGTSDKDKPEDANKDKSKDSKDKPEGVPDEYADFDLPEGIEVDSERLSHFKEFAKSNKLTQEAAQNLVDLHTDAVSKFATSQQDQWDKIKEGWAGQVKADKELQDEGGSTDAAIATALKAVDNLGGAELKEALELTGAGSHPAVVKAFFKMGQKMAEDGFVFGGGGAVDNRSPADKLFPSMRNKQK